MSEPDIEVIKDVTLEIPGVPNNAFFFEGKTGPGLGPDGEVRHYAAVIMFGPLDTQAHANAFVERLLDPVKAHVENTYVKRSS